MTVDAAIRPSPSHVGANGGHIPAATAPLPHIDDLLAIPTDINVNQTIRKLLEQAEMSFQQSEIGRDYGRPALALREYIRASVIAVQTITRHQDYHTLRNTSGESGRAYATLLKRISQQSDTYEQVKRDIIIDNKRTGVRPTLKSSAAALSAPRAHANGSEALSLSVNGRASSTTRSVSTERSSPSLDGLAIRSKPVVHPKPQSLHGQPLQRNEENATKKKDAQHDLQARFSQLGGPKSSPGQDPRIKTYPIPAKPAGPRAMPHPSKPVPEVGAAESVLPKMPDAIYSPARGSVSIEAASLPTSTTHRGLFSRAASTASVTTIQSSAREQASDVPLPRQESKRREETENAVDLPPGNEITAEQLYTQMKRQGSILLIDIRSRQDFNEGHIMSSSVICIEPSILLRENISSDDISESMVLSPTKEQALFGKRAEYGLVVFYDQSTHRYPSRAENSDELAAMSLYRALVHLNFGRELRRPPRLLKGGLDSWVDLMGQQALQVFTPRPSAPGPARPQKGLQQRRGSRYVVTSLLPADVRAWQSTLEKDARQTATRPDFPRTADEFLRLPPARSEQQSMVSPDETPSIHIPETSHAFHSPAQLPAPPTRPQAAVQRPSHSGLSHGDEERGAETNASFPPASMPNGRRTVEQPPIASSRPITGLNNPRNWCYANSTLQSLLASPDFGKDLAHSAWVPDFQVPRTKSDKIDPPQLLMRILSNLFHWMDSGKFHTLKAQTLMDYSRHLCKSSDVSSQFGGPDQQDAQEFMSFLMEQLHDETNLYRNREGNAPQPKTSDQHLLQNARNYWRAYSGFNQSIIDRYWRGLELSTVQCSMCATRTHTFSPFSWISVSVSGQDKPLAEALKEYTASNKLEDFECERCRGKRQATQSMHLARMPPLLCVGFRRFSFDGKGLFKSNTALTWDFNDFDFSPYFLPFEDTEETATEEREFCRPFRYQCYAVIVHAGRSLNSGHYYAYVRDSSTHDPYAWYCCNDSVVKKVRIGSGDGLDVQKQVFRSDTDQVPYLVFFKRKG